MKLEEMLIFIMYYCLLIEVYCGVKIIKRMKQVSDIHTKQRRRNYRTKAYAEVRKRSIINKNRSEVWGRVAK